MKNTVRILGIAPYEGMKTQMLTLAESYPQIDLTVFIGDLEQGLKIAKSNFHGDYDVIISRGATARMLRQNLTLPVIEIDISVYDILCAIKLANGMKAKTAMVSIANISQQTQSLCELLECEMDIYSVDSLEDVEPALLLLQQKNYHSILCDMIVNTTAQQLGINSFLITSGIDSIRRAFDQALLLCRSQQHLRDENLFFRSLLQGQIGQTVVFDNGDNLFFSTQSDLKPEVLDMLRQELPKQKNEAERRITRSIGGMLYPIRIRNIANGDLTYTAFFFDSRKLPISPNQVGIRFLSRTEAENAYYNSIYSFSGNLHVSQAEIERINQSTSPVIVTGEDGTGKESIVSMLYIRSTLRNNPLVSINCSLLTDRSWTFLMEHYNSPLSDEGNTIYFSNLDVLSQERQYQLIAILTEMDVCRRNRVMFSCICPPNEFVSQVGSLFQDKLTCLSLYLPTLRSQAGQIPMLVNLLLSHMNVNIPTQVLGASQEALSLLQSYEWPHNFTQFRRVISELTIICKGQIITAENVRRILRKERHVGAFSVQAENASTPLDLSRTLSEINKDVVQRVIAETEGNHSAAAKRLGISRTTLWRMLQKDMS